MGNGQLAMGNRQLKENYWWLDELKIFYGKR